ncbi:Huwe1, partial [Symbiodinium pilosum]
ESPWKNDWERFAGFITFRGEAGYDSGGVGREWNSLVLKSLVLPDDWRPESLKCLLLGECVNSSTPQFLLEALPSGDVIPILGIHRELAIRGAKERDHDVLRKLMADGRDLAVDIKQEFDKEGYLRAGLSALSKVWGLARQEVSNVADEGLVNLWASRARWAVAQAKQDSGREGFLRYWMVSAYTAGLGILNPGKLPVQTLEQYGFLGEWLARAYVIGDKGFAPAGFPDIFYEGLLKGHMEQPSSAETFYQEEDTIAECEWLASLLGRRSPTELETYGWASCSEVKDPETKRYMDEGCYKPLYRDEGMWDVLFTEWGTLAPLDAKVGDAVPFDRAKEYTQLHCRRTWETRVLDPFNQMIAGFRRVIPSTKFWRKVTAFQELKRLVEGNPTINLRAFLEAARFENFSEMEKQLFFAVLADLQAQGVGLPPMQQPLNQLVRFFTGSYKDPVRGWHSADPEVRKIAQEKDQKCAPLAAHTCYSMLDVPENCLKDRKVLEEIILESIATEDFGMA